MASPPFSPGQIGGLPYIKGLVRLLIERFEQEATLLAVCPNSESVVRAALLAAHEADAPLLFAATLNQVDLDGGYTGWTPRALVDFITEEATRLTLKGPVLPCLDHGGPWLKDAHTRHGYTYEETLAAVKRSLEACIDAGYALLHIDPTVDRTMVPGQRLPIERVIERTLVLIAHAEAYRQQKGNPPLSYEVGTEEVHGGLADLTTFEAFVEGLDAGLRARGLLAAWPAFVVGKVGTDLHTTTFDADVARRLTQYVKPYGALVKGHYTDYVNTPEAYPRSGMGGANVGPEFTEEEYKALMDLVRLEHTLGADSGLERALRRAVTESDRWQKWLHDHERGRAFNALDDARQQWLTRTGSRYIWTAPEVAAARQRLYDNVAPHTDGPAYVIGRIKTAILKYFEAFNLIHFNRILLD